MSQDNIRVLVVDDSAVSRAMIGNQIEAAADMSLAGMARNGRDAIDKAASLRPDVITLDLRMPDMDGLEVLDEVLRLDPIPIIMVSALTYAGAAVTLDALDHGAVDYVAKPERVAGVRATFGVELVAKIRSAAGVDVRRMMAARKKRSGFIKAPEEPNVKAKPEMCPAELADKCVALGISTGGPPALSRLLGDIRAPMPPMVVVQHMPPQFTGPLASRLDSASVLSVREAAHGDLLQPNCVLVAPGGKHLEISRRGAQPRVLIRDGETVSGHRPSVDVMMTGAAKAFGPNCLGVIMTGMGHDGVDGCCAIRAAGGYVLGQDEASSDVYGMNKIAFRDGHVDQQFSLSEAATAIMRHVRLLGRKAAMV